MKNGENCVQTKSRLSPVTGGYCAMCVRGGHRTCREIRVRRREMRREMRSGAGARGRGVVKGPLLEL